MTITNSTRLVTYTGNGVTTEFDFTFLIPTGALVVTLYEIATGVEGDPLSDALYSVTGLDDAAGGTVTYPLVGSPLAATHKINIKRDVAATQDLNLTNQSPYFPEELEEQLDRIVMMIQQNKETLDRAVTVVPGSGIDPADLIADLTAANAAAVASAAAAAVDAAAADVDATAAAASAVAAAASAASAASALGTKVSKSGDSMTGDLSISKTSPTLYLQKSASGQVARLASYLGAAQRWALDFGDGTAESGANSGSDFALSRFSDAGALIDVTVTVNRATGLVTLGAGQIKFPATQNPSSDANTLDDYEEGTFTPAYSSTGATFAYASQIGEYTKIGNRVMVHIRIGLAASGTTLSANALSITGLPFANGSSVTISTLLNWTQATSSYVTMGCTLAAGATTLAIVGITAASVSSGAVVNSNAGLSNSINSILNLQMHYRV